MSQKKRTQFPAWVVILVLSALIITTFSVLLVMGTLKLVPEPPYDPEVPFMLYVLTAFNFAAFSVFSFILARLLLRLRREQRAGRLGFRLKSRLLLYFAVISILPLVALGVFSYLFINVTIDKWFGQHHQTIVRESQYIYQQYATDETQDLDQMTETLRAFIETFQDPEVTPALPRVASLARNNPKLVFIQVINGSGQILLARQKSEFQAPSALTPLLEKARTKLLAGAKFTDRIPGQEKKPFLSLAAVPFQSRAGGLVAVYQSSPELADRAANIAYQHELYESLYRKQGKIRRTTFQVLGLITFLLLFAATWTAMHLAKGITVPIQALAEATQQVAEGDFNQTVNCLAEDELAMLVDSFNQMTAQLKENRQQLEASARRLRQTNLRLEERRRYIETLLESLSTGIISVDPEDRITTVNQAALRILNLSSQPSPQSRLLETLTPVLNQQNVRTIDRLLQRAKRTSFATEELELSGPAGASHLVVGASALRSQSGQLQGLVIMFEDITELVRAQRQLVWGEVARRMAHEIKNPLTPIQLSAERIKKNLGRYGPALTDDRYKQLIKECTTTILSEVHTLQLMVNEFTRFARLPPVKLRNASLNQVVRTTLKLYADRLNGITIETDLSETLPPIQLDAEQIKRALVNLIDNAIAALHQVDGEQRITVVTRYLAKQEIGQIVISDTGAGIDANDYSKLFTPYFSKRAQGTGLGLAIVSHIVAEHRGKVRAEPNDPHGARFTIELPVSQSLELTATS